MKTYTRNSTYTPLKPYCYLAKQEDFLEITDWYNREGIDVTITTQNGEKFIQLTHGQLQALVAAYHYKEQL